MAARVFDLLHAEAPSESSPADGRSALRTLLETRPQGEPSPLPAEEFLAPRVGRIVSVDPQRAVHVLFPGAAQPTRARLAFPVSVEQLEQARVDQQEVLLVFENADRDRPIITGLISVATRAPAAQEPSVALPAGLSIDADADGRRLRLSAQEEIVFHCGKASVTLTSSGRVIVRGTYVETYASGTNRIKGGQVRIN